MSKKMTPRKRLFKSAIFPVIFVAVMWAVHLIQHYSGTTWAEYGILPRDFTGLRGILFSPFLHGSWSHLINNTYPMLILGTAVFYFYPKSAWKVIIYGTLIGGFWVWVGARSSFHIGASGLIYSLAFFVFFSGLFNKNRNMMGLSLITVFLYGGMVWGLLQIDYKISWEGHLFGAIIGVLLAWIYRKDGPQRKKYSWDYDGDYSPIPESMWRGEDFSGSDRDREVQKGVRVSYHYKPKEEKDQ
jgi:membrane associated rhomboid family serine protease